MRTCFDEILTNFPGNLTFTGADEGDYHVHAGAIAGKADILLTGNASVDFAVTQQAYEILTPDEFFELVARSNPACLMPICKEQIAYWTNKPKYLQLDAALMNADCFAFSVTIKQVMQTMAKFP